INFDIYNPRNGEIYGRDPRQVAKKAEAYLASTGIADTAFFAPEAEFFIFDEVRYETKANTSYHFVDSIEGTWNSAREVESDGGRNLGNKTPYKGGYFPVSPVDHLADIRDEIVLNLEKAGLSVERSHHEVGTAGQCEINYRFDTLLKSADDVMKFKYIVKNTAFNYNKTATFMPKPLFGDNGSGMHVHQSLWKDGKPLFYDENGYGGLSDLARWYIGGLLKHAPSLLAFTNPTVNSYHRLVPGFEAPVNLVYSAGNRSAAIRIPMTGTNPKAKRIEFRAPDASGNAYLAFAAMLMAGLDGIKNRIEPHAPVDKDLYELPPEEAKNIPQVPGSLEEVLKALEADHDYLIQGDVFTKDLIETWIDYKREKEIKPFAQRPHPYEFELYYGV
ncbi:MAG: type I glutamate--ammonia ligase, partial [Micrococcales bacterium]|nr:type I glutamate--ammonia ligase [Micrococcales bacterium]